MPIAWPSSCVCGLWPMADSSPIDLARPEIRALRPYASARALADSAGILLNANENPWAPPGDHGQQLNRYPDPQPAELVQRLSKRYGIAPECLLITRGSDEGIDLLTRAFCRPGLDQVVICPPCFGMYALSARIQGAQVIEVPLLEQAGNWRLDRAGMDRALPARLLYLCSPNNPTGSEIPIAEVERLALAQRHQGLVVLDEAYIEFSAAESMTNLIERCANLVVLRTLSKAWALAGCRLGVLIARREVIELLRRIIAPYPLPTPAIQAALRALDAPDRLTRQLAILAAQKQRLVAALNAHPAVVRLWPGQANFILIRVADAQALVARASQAGLRLRDQSAQRGLDQCVRITIGRPKETTALIEFFSTLPA